MINLERRGIPTVMVVSKPFESIGRRMAAMDGIPDYPFVVVPHPVTVLDNNGVDDLMKHFFPQILGLLMARTKA
jgi:hypothetical protein